MRKVLVPVCAVAMLSLVASVYANTTAIDQVGQKFSMPTVTISKGDTLSWKNTDDVTHNINVTGSDGQAEDQGLQKPGETITKTFTAADEYSVRCAIHPRMKMTVIVK